MDDLLRQKTIKEIRKPSFGICVCLTDLNLINLSLVFCCFFKKNKLPLSLSWAEFFFNYVCSKQKRLWVKELSLSVFRRMNEAGMKNRQCVKFSLFLINAATNLILIKLLLPAPHTPSPPYPPTQSSHTLATFFSSSLESLGDALQAQKKLFIKPLLL